MTIPLNPNDAQTWRELADELTPDQLAAVIKIETDTPESPALAQALLDMARDHVRKNRDDRSLFGNLAEPSAAVHIWHWEKSDRGYWTREFSGSPRVVANLEVVIDGVQRSDGSIRRWASVYSKETAELSPAELRSAAAALTAAADELERLQ